MGRQRDERILLKTHFNGAFFLAISALVVGVVSLLPSSAANALSLNLKLPVLDTTVDISQSQNTSATSDTVSPQGTTSTSSEQITDNENAVSSDADASSAADENSPPDPGKITPLSPLPFIDTTIDDNRVAQMKLEPTLASTEESRQTQAATPVGILESTSRGWRIFGIFWYWWVAGIGAVAVASYTTSQAVKRARINTVVS